MRLPSEIELDRAHVARRGLVGFLELAWPMIEPDAKLVLGRHHEEVSKHLMAVSWGVIDRLITNIPPGFTKSILVCIAWPLWDWIHNPWRKWMFSSFDQTLTYRDSDKTKEILESEWYRSRWGDLAGNGDERLVIRDGSRPNTTGIWFNRAGGLRFATSVKSKATGWHAHIQVADDPNKPHDAKGGKVSAGADPAELENVRVWWESTMASRKADPKKFARVIIQQRVHDSDLTGHCLRKPEQGWTHLRLPMRFEKQSECDCPNCAEGGCKTVVGGDWRQEDGELLHPERYDEEATKQTEADMGPIVAAAQLAQNPSPPGGALIKDEWLLHRYNWDPRKIKFDRVIQSWDCTFKDLTTSDRVAGTVWGQIGSDFYLLDVKVDQMGFLATLQAIKDTSEKWPQTRGILVEDKANGSAILQTLRVTDGIPGLLPVEPYGSKIARAEACTPFFNAGNVILPEKAPWVSDYVTELTKFPFYRFDDLTDSTTQAIIYLTDSKRHKRLTSAMEKMRKRMFGSS